MTALPRSPDRSPPYSAEAEEHVIACCLLEGDRGLTVRRALDAGLTPDSFYLPANRLIFEVASGLPDPALDLVISELQSRRQLDAVGGLPYLMQVTSGIGTTAHAGHFIEKVGELATKRTLIRQATTLVEHAYNGTTLEELAEQAKSLVPSASGKTHVLADLLSRRVTAATPPKEPVTRLFLNDKPIATPGNLQTITAKSKIGKTAATGAAVAAVIVATTGTAALHDTFKFRASNPNGHAVIIIDTEQSPFDAWTCYQRILARAGETQDPKWLLHFALVGYSVAKRKAALLAALEYAKKTFGGVFLVVIDGVAHFVSSVNELEECNVLADWLRELSVTYDTAMVCVIHANEGDKAGDDSRGHLGKQLMRDAESNLLMKKVGDITTVTSERQRKAPITEDDGIAFKWSDEAKRHVLCEPVSGKVKGGRSRLHTIQEFWECIPAKGSTPMTGTQIHRHALQLVEIKPNTFKDLLAEAARDGSLIRTYDKNVGYSYARAL